MEQDKNHPFLQDLIQLQIAQTKLLLDIKNLLNQEEEKNNEPKKFEKWL